jgi:hypothetical protein
MEYFQEWWATGEKQALVDALDAFQDMDMEHIRSLSYPNDIDMFHSMVQTYLYAYKEGHLESLDTLISRLVVKPEDSRNMAREIHLYCHITFLYIASYTWLRGSEEWELFWKKSTEAHKEYERYSFDPSLDEEPDAWYGNDDVESLIDPQFIAFLVHDYKHSD